jgi:hypothetical protein
MPSYQATASKPGTGGQPDLFVSHEFEAPDTAAAMAQADTWSTSDSVVSSGPTSIRLYAGKVLLFERSAPNGTWEKVNRS